MGVGVVYAGPLEGRSGRRARRPSNRTASDRRARLMSFFTPFAWEKQIPD
jgi:hypothetical protein